ncbi:MAG: transglutaminase family protein [Polyangiales bacterium]
MRVYLRHRTSYRYSVPVYLGPHVLRLTPRLGGDGGAGFRSHAIRVQPQPAAQRDSYDEFGNQITRLEFTGTTQLLSIDSQAEVEPGPVAPLPHASLQPLPWFDASEHLQPYLRAAERDPNVQQFAQELVRRAPGDALPFLDSLAQTLYSRTRQQSRIAGGPRPVGVTLAQQEGSCRDLAVLFIAACREVGIASRFTSGYSVPSDHTARTNDLHAWVEVWLPGIGWRGWDPAQGQRVSGSHVPLCAAASPAATLPVEGGFSFVGQILNTTLEYDIQIDTSG